MPKIQLMDITKFEKGSEDWAKDQENKRQLKNCTLYQLQRNIAIENGMWIKNVPFVKSRQLFDNSLN